MDDLQKPPRPAFQTQQNQQKQNNYQKIVHEKKNIQIAKNERNSTSLQAGQQDREGLDEIMSEMQTLNIRPSAICSVHCTFDNRADKSNNQSDVNTSQVAPVDEQLKIKILEWLTNDVRLLKPMNDKQRESLLQYFPSYSRTGVIFADLINRLNGRNEVIKGVYRNPPKGTTSQIQANFTKVMNYFKQFPRFCPRYLWSTQQMIEGSADVIWGFFDDIWHWNFKKISPYDPAYKKQPATVIPASKSAKTLQPSLERQAHGFQKLQSVQRSQDFDVMDGKGQDVQPQHYQSAVSFQNRNFENMPMAAARLPPIKKAKPPNFDKNQMQLMQPRSILPGAGNILFEKRPQSAKNMKTMISRPMSCGGFASGQDTANLQFQSLVASASQNLQQNSMRRGHSSQGFSRQQLSMSEKRKPNAHIQKGHEYSQKVKTRNKNVRKIQHSSAGGGPPSPLPGRSPRRRDRSKKSSVGFDFSNQQELKRGIEPLFNESAGSFEQELDQLDDGKQINKKSYDLPRQKSPQTISPILKNKAKKQHKFDATAQSKSKNHDLEVIAGLFQDDDDAFDPYKLDNYDAMMQQSATADEFANQIVCKRKGKGFKILNQYDIFPSGSEKGETNELLMSWNRQKGQNLDTGGQANGNRRQINYSPGENTSDAGVLGLLGPQQPIGYDILEGVARL